MLTMTWICVIIIKSEVCPETAGKDFPYRKNGIKPTFFTIMGIYTQILIDEVIF